MEPIPTIVLHRYSINRDSWTHWRRPFNNITTQQSTSSMISSNGSICPHRRSRSDQSAQWIITSRLLSSGLVSESSGSYEEESTEDQGRKVDRQSWSTTVRQWHSSRKKEKLRSSHCCMLFKDDDTSHESSPSPSTGPPLYLPAPPHMSSAAPCYIPESHQSFYQNMWPNFP